jgi:hypothetical protein
MDVVIIYPKFGNRASANGTKEPSGPHDTAGGGVWAWFNINGAKVTLSTVRRLSR